MRHLLLIAVAVLAGCQTTTASRTDPEAAMTKLPAGCPMRVDFPGPVTIKDDAADDLLPPSAVAIQISAMKNGGAYSLMCICTETANSALLTPDFVKKTRGRT